MKNSIIFIFFLLFLFCVRAQDSVFVMGNVGNICLPPSLNYRVVDELSDIENCKTILIFSGASSILQENDLALLALFSQQGGGIYLGFDNWPLQAEGIQFLSEFFQIMPWGNFESTIASVNSPSIISSLNTIPAGYTTVAFPMDPRFHVEAWIDDQPFILSRESINGRIIIDGGYSRFYCPNFSEDTSVLLNDFIHFLMKK